MKESKQEINREPFEIKYKSGFDNPLSDIAGDKLDRQRLINQIYPYLIDLEPEWSVRVGLLAPWGEGKTTVCQWIAQQAAKDGHIPVWFSPWSARTDAELWYGFYSALKKALEDYNSKLKDPILSITTLKRLGASIAAREWVDQISRSHQTGQAGLQALKSLTKMKPKDIERLNGRLEGRRFIVIIDDLDRVNPKLIPILLMSLRDVLDLGRFSFLLPFDETIICESLMQYNASPKFGEDFLDKILDFRFRLDSPTSYQIENFFKYEMKAHCSFVPDVALEGLAQHLPSSPRKLKFLARGIKVFEAQAARHKKEEIDWQAIIFSQMIRLESEAFFEAYTNKTFFSHSYNNPEFSPWHLAEMSDDEDAAKNNERARVEIILDDVGVRVPQKRDRLIQLCESWRGSSSAYTLYNIQYVLKLLNQPHILTWAEFDSFLDCWSREQEFFSLRPWFDAHALKIKKPTTEVVYAVMTTLSKHYDLLLQQASSVVVLKDQEAYITRAEKIIDLFCQYVEFGLPDIDHAEILSVDIFKSLLHVIKNWCHFVANESDSRLRIREESLLKKWVCRARDLDLDKDYHPFLIEQSKSESHVYERKGFYQLLSGLERSFTLEFEKNVHETFRTSQGIRGIFRGGVCEDIKKSLLDANSAVWTPHGDSPAEKILLNAAKNSTIQINAWDFLDLLKNNSQKRAGRLAPEKISQFLAHQSLIVAIWDAAVATELQYRFLYETRSIRDFLIKNKISQDQLSMPDWLS
ncbi:MAG: hypothetical protein Tsb002_02950 [Wenzhouxiangellaceae bacterium]